MSGTVTGLSLPSDEGTDSGEGREGDEEVEGGREEDEEMEEVGGKGPGVRFCEGCMLMGCCPISLALIIEGLPTFLITLGGAWVQLLSSSAAFLFFLSALETTSLKPFASDWVTLLGVTCPATSTGNA